MKITPRAVELQHVADAIDKDHETLDKAARAAIKAVGEAIAARDLFTIVEVGPGVPLLWGIYATEGEAVKARDKLISLGCMERLLIRPVKTAAGVIARTEGQPWGEDCECGHATWMHLEGKNKGRGKCAISTCECAKYTKGEHPLVEYPTCITCSQLVLA